MLCWYVICLFILYGIILCFRQGSKVEVEQFHWLVIPCINIFEIKKIKKNQSSASLAFVRGIHRRPVNSPHKMASYAENVFIWWRHHVAETFFVI